MYCSVLISTCGYIVFIKTIKLILKRREGERKRGYRTQFRESEREKITQLLCKKKEREFVHII